jgi:hypothetical protein
VTGTTRWSRHCSAQRAATAAAARCGAGRQACRHSPFEVRVLCPRVQVAGDGVEEPQSLQHRPYDDNHTHRHAYARKHTNGYTRTHTDTHDAVRMHLARRDVLHDAAPSVVRPAAPARP